MVHLDQYSFGRLVVDGREIRSDVLITPDGVREHWGRRDGHVLCLDDLGAVLDDHVKRLVVGTGAYGRMRPEPGLETELVERGFVTEVLETAAAVDRVNELLGVGAADWAAAMHLTC